MKTKIYTVIMAVHHGDLLAVEKASANNVHDALSNVLKTSLGVGYGLKPHTRQFYKGCLDLISDGAHTWGWAEYKLEQTEG